MRLVRELNHKLSRTDSYRRAIFDKVCTPKAVDLDDQSNTGKEKSTAEIRDRWKKAFLETLLLIRMEKEHHDTRARLDDSVPPTRKLEYEELTPCLKNITTTWEELLEAGSREDGVGSQGDETEAGNCEAGQNRAIDLQTLTNNVKEGVPRELRGQIWLFLMQQRQKRTETADMDCGPAPYEALLKQLTTHQHAILIDLGRTFPKHPYFSKALGPGQLELFNLLKAYSLLDREVGYCQGISFIVGMLLMHMEEVSAFHVLKYMMYDLGIRKQFRPNMMALQIKLYQLTRLLHDHYSEVYHHFEVHDISPTLYAAPWFLTLFTSQFPLGFVARVFDMIFIQGDVALFKIALLLLGNHQALILQCNSFESTVEFLKMTLPEMVNVQMERIINQAFELDIGQQLATYETEYKMYSEELTFDPARVTRGQGEIQSSLDKSCQTTYEMEFVLQLEEEKDELVNKLQHAQSQQRSLDNEVHAQKLDLDVLHAKIATLELERRSLLNVITELHKLVPHGAIATFLAEKESGRMPDIPDSLTLELDRINSENGVDSSDVESQNNIPPLQSPRLARGRRSSFSNSGSSPDASDHSPLASGQVLDSPDVQGEER